MAVYCVIHDALEEQPEGSFQCFECKHVYNNEAALVMAYNAMQERMHQESLEPHPFEEIGLPRIIHIPDVKKVGDDIPYCPHCMHDF